MRRSLPLLILMLLIMAAARDASADLTALAGANRTPSNRTVGGAALSLSLLLIGFEFEYSHNGEDPSAGAPSLRTGMFNMEFQTPTVSGLRFYGTVGGGLYRERLAAHQETGFGANVGGGVKIHRRRADRGAVRLPRLLTKRRPAPRQPTADLRRVQRGVLTESRGRQRPTGPRGQGERGGAPRRARQPPKSRAVKNPGPSSD